MFLYLYQLLMFYLRFFLFRNLTVVFETSVLPIQLLKEILKNKNDLKKESNFHVRLAQVSCCQLVISLYCKWALSFTWANHRGLQQLWITVHESRKIWGKVTGVFTLLSYWYEKMASFLGDHTPPLLLAWNHLILSKLGRRVEAARRLNSYRFFENQKWGRGRNYSCPVREPAVCTPETQDKGCPASWASQRSQTGLVVSTCASCSWALLHAWLLGVEEGAGGAVSVGQREEQKSVGGRSGRVGEGSHRWEGWGYRGWDVIEGENPNRMEAKPHQCCYLWNDLLNSDTLLSVTISRGILTKEHRFEMKDWNWREKGTSSGL